MRLIRMMILLAALVVLGSCGQPRVVGPEHLLGHAAILEEETTTGYLIRVEDWQIMSYDAQPHLCHRERVVIPKDRVVRDPALKIGQMILVDGGTLRPIPPNTLLPFLVPPQFTSP